MRQINSLTACWSAAVLVIAVCASGCGPRMGTLQGSVIFDAKPVDRGHIVLVRNQGDTQIYRAHVMSGTFSLVAPAGTYRVEIFAFHDDATLAADPKLPMQYIPPQYNSASTLTTDILPHDRRELKFDLPK